MSRTDPAACPDCGGEIGWAFPFGPLECLDCGRGFTVGDEL